jgi:mannitol/fructose-specific phosphotransferase system IIA component (Ntr-type)
MKIIISKTFSKKYLGKLSKYFSEEDFVQKLRNTHTITLKYPHFKVKIRMNMVEFR